MVFEIFENFLAIKTAMLIAAPSIDRIAASIQLQIFHHLAESAVRGAGKGSQLNHNRRPQEINQQHCKRNVSGPCFGRKSDRLREADRMQQWSKP